MRFGVLGTGMVGTTIGSRLVDLGHEVRLGSRSPGGDRAAAWVAEAGGGASEGSLADAAAFGEAVVNCTAGAGSLEALRAAGEENLAGKLLIDVANPLERSGDSGPRLSVVGDDSLGERIQREVPRARVVKALNTMNCAVMVDPTLVEGDHVAFICGEDRSAKAEATRLLGELGWPAQRVIDLGGISAARATEATIFLWVRIAEVVGSYRFNFEIAREASN
jgi:predicted dinucleotide-binding enzyme